MGDFTYLIGLAILGMIIGAAGLFAAPYYERKVRRAAAGQAVAAHR